MYIDSAEIEIQIEKTRACAFRNRSAFIFRKNDIIFRVMITIEQRQ